MLIMRRRKPLMDTTAVRYEGSLLRARANTRVGSRMNGAPLVTPCESTPWLFP